MPNVPEGMIESLFGYETLPDPLNMGLADVGDKLAELEYRTEATGIFVAGCKSGHNPAIFAKRFQMNKFSVRYIVLIRGVLDF